MISLHGTVEVGSFSREFSVDIGNEIVGIFGVDEVTDPNYNGWISRKHKE